MRKNLFVVRFLLLCCLLGVTKAGKECCKAKLGLQELEPEFIKDPNEVPPKEFEGQLRYVDDPDDFRPDDWDDEDDGTWEPRLVSNSNFAWMPSRTIPNPKYVPPPSYGYKLRAEVQSALPWVTLGVLVTGLLSLVALPYESLRRSLDGKGFGTLLLAALLGLATPLCSCGALPIAAGLVHQGIPLASVLTFLTASQSAGLDSAAITWGLLGPTAVLARLGGAIFLAVSAGLACPTRTKQQIVLSKSTNNMSSGDTCHPTTAAVGLIPTLLETAVEIVPTVFMGLALSTAALHYLPSLISFEQEDNNNSLLVRWGVLGSAIPLQLCEHTTVTLAAAIQKAGGSPGLAFSFLLSAPATNVPTLLLLLQHGGARTVARIIVVTSLTALFLSYGVDAVQWDLLVGADPGDMATLPNVFVAAAPYLVGGLFVAGLIHKHVLKPKADCCADSNDKKTKKD